jgi:hypothetical protein
VRRTKLRWYGMIRKKMLGHREGAGSKTEMAWIDIKK